MQLNICNDKTDEELAFLALRNEQYFLCLMQKYEAKLLRYIARISNFDEDEAKDVLQETFIKVFKNLNDFDKSLKFSSWIYRITHNEVIDNFRKTKRRPEKILWDKNEEFIKNIADEFNLEQEFDKKIGKENLFKNLNLLDYKYKEVLELRFLEDKSYKEISDILKKPEGTVATLISRAKKQYKDYAGRNFKPKSA
ncbi:MAG: RNA polymerase sigma factor [Patescibacteria group bacterium]